MRVTAEEPALEADLQRLMSVLEERGFAPRRSDGGAMAAGAAPGIRLAVEGEASGGPEAYRLTVDRRGIRISAGAATGLSHGISTLLQWLDLHSPALGSDRQEVHGLEIEDWPDFPRRGVMLDVSRDKVPTMATLRALVERLASWKTNELQLYTEHTFAYRGHETVWRHASPLTAEEIRELDLHCSRRGIDLVPNQNSLGHFHRWLAHDEYRHLGECPEGVKHDHSDRREPFSLCPTDPASLALLDDLYDQLLPLFSSRRFNVGLDETFDLGLGRSAAACEARGTGRVYLEFLQEIHRRLAVKGFRMQFWADIVKKHPELVPELPRDAVPLIWGYEAGSDFAGQGRELAAAGLDFYVCPGTSSWNSFAGRTSNALLNLGRAATEGRQTGAEGYLITDWGDFGHLQPLSVSYLGLLAGAGFAWNTGAAADPLDLDIAALLDRWALPGLSRGAGRLAVDLGNTYLEAGATPKNGSALFFLALFPDRDLDGPHFAGMETEKLERTQERLGRARDRLDQLAMADPEAALARRELQWAAEMLHWTTRLGLARLANGRHRPTADLPAAEKAPLARDLQPLIDEHRALWLARNRPGGLQDSAARLLRLRDRLT